MCWLMNPLCASSAAGHHAMQLDGAERIPHLQPGTTRHNTALPFFYLAVLLHLIRGLAVVSQQAVQIRLQA